MPSYNATMTLDRAHTGAAFADEVHGGELDAFHAVTGTDDRGRAQVVITVTAENLSQAAITARNALSGFGDMIAFTVTTTAEYDRIDETIPELITVSEAAAQLHITRQAVQHRIDHGTLPARQVGRQWVIAASSLAGATVAG